MTVFCDAQDCMHIDEFGFCDCDKLDVVGGVCQGSVHGSRNVIENEEVEKLKKENAKLWEFANMFATAIKWWCDCCNCCPYDKECGTEAEPMTEACKLYSKMRELGIEVDE